MVGRNIRVLIHVMIALACASFRSAAFVVLRSHHQAWRHQSRACCSVGVAAASVSSQLFSLEDTHQHTFEQCWKASTWSVNPQNDTRVDTLLQRLCSPAPQSLFVLTRAIQARNTSDFLQEILSKCSFLLKPGYEFQVREGEWRIEASNDENDDHRWQSVKPGADRNAVELAHEALDLVLDASEQHYPVNDVEIDTLAQQAKNRLDQTLGTDLRGRSSVDVAFSFAVAGVKDKELYQTLALVARLELERIGERPSFRSKYILQMVEKLAASGITDGDVYRVAADCLASKGEHLDVVEMLCRPNGFNLFSPRPLLWLWRFSARQRKVNPAEFQVMKSYASSGDWVKEFEKPLRPLVVDLGCGMGISLLGLASMDQESQEAFNSSPEGALLNDLDWRGCNYVGGDLSQLCLGYARGIAQRWGFDGRLQFTYGSALDLLESIESRYPGRVALIMIQFPTPFQMKTTGNPQLPSDFKSGFMVSEQLMYRVRRILERSQGTVLLQSNCEDVAVTMRRIAEDLAGFERVKVPSCVQLASLVGSNDDDGSLRKPRRTLDWIDRGGERAVGDGWSTASLIPSRGATETEISCQLNKTPIHRCLLQLSK